MAWYDHLEYGDPVVCVDATPSSPRKTWDLRQNAIYRFRSIQEDTDRRTYNGPYQGSLIMQLVGVTNPHHFNNGFAPERFRPATSTDLPASIREALKTPAPKEKV